MDDGDAQVQAFYEDNAPEGSAAWMWLPPRWKALWRRAHQLETVFASAGPTRRLAAFLLLAGLCLITLSGLGLADD